MTSTRPSPDPAAVRAIQGRNHEICRRWDDAACRRALDEVLRLPWLDGPKAISAGCRRGAGGGSSSPDARQAMVSAGSFTLGALSWGRS